MQVNALSSVGDWWYKSDTEKGDLAVPGISFWSEKFMANQKALTVAPAGPLKELLTKRRRDQPATGLSYHRSFLSTTRQYVSHVSEDSVLNRALLRTIVKNEERFRVCRGCDLRHAIAAFDPQQITYGNGRYAREFCDGCIMHLAAFEQRRANYWRTRAIEEGLAQ